MKKIFFILIVIYFILSARLVSAQVVFNEVQLLPTDNRYIELYNTSGSSVDLTGWYIQRKTSTGASYGSLVSSTNFENKSIGAGEYFLISRSALTSSHLVLSNLTLTESNSIQIKNAAGEVVDKICWGESSECSSAGVNPTETQSLSRDSIGSYSLMNPTPGQANSGTNTSPNTPATTSGSSIITSESTTKKLTTEPTKIKIISNTPVFIATPTEFKVEMTGAKENHYGKYFWNFGDGTSEERRVSGQNSFPHTFYYEGEYLVALQYFENSYQDKPIAVDKVIVKVTEVVVRISRVGDEKDFFVEISNETNYDIDLTDWFLVSSSNKFVFPVNTILDTKKKMIISPIVSGFLSDDSATLGLFDKWNKKIYDYGATLETAPKQQIIQLKQTSNFPPKSDLGENDEEVQAKPSLPSLIREDLAAQAVDTKDGGGSKNETSYIVGLVLFLGLCSGSLYYLRSQNSIEPEIGLPGEDFEIIDE